MNNFTAFKSAAFIGKLFAGTGFDFDAALKAGDENALKAHIEKQIAAAKTGDADQQKLIESAVAENEKLESSVATATANMATLRASYDAISSSLAASGITADTFTTAGAFDAVKFKAAHEAAIAKAARVELAKSGHPGIAEQTTADPTKPGAQRALTRAEFNALSPKERMAFSKSSGKLTE